MQIWTDFIKLDEIIKDAKKVKNDDTVAKIAIYKYLEGLGYTPAEFSKIKENFLKTENKLHFFLSGSFS
ncbi:MAG: hypothetical protein ACMUEM_04810 [Flavobacteriales bacterium AspAUS03]